MGKRKSDLEAPDSTESNQVGRLVYVSVACAVLAPALIGLLGGWQLYQAYYDAMHSRHLDGLPFIFLMSLAISLVATPFFAHHLASSPGDEPQNAMQVMQLYGSVLGILFGALSLVLLLLWLLGWLRVWLYIAYRSVLSWLNIAALLGV